MAITAEQVVVHNGLMDKANTSAILTAPGRGTVTRINKVRRAQRDLERAREARRGLRPRSERFAHLKRMYD